MSDAFSGSTISFASSNVLQLVSISYDETGNEIDVTDAADTLMQYDAGTPDVTVTAEVIGTDHGISVGDTGAISISWNDGGSDSLSSALCTGVSHSGSVNDKLTASLTFKPANA